jgi:hypothetical protein
VTDITGDFAAPTFRMDPTSPARAVIGGSGWDAALFIEIW